MRNKTLYSVFKDFALKTCLGIFLHFDVILKSAKTILKGVVASYHSKCLDTLLHSFS